MKTKRGKNNKKDNYIYSNFKFGLHYIKNLKAYFLTSLFLFLLIGIFGFLFPYFFKEQIMNLIAELLRQTKDLGIIDLISFIISNNIKSAFLGMIFGVFLGIIPLMVIIINGYVLGFVAKETVGVEGFSVLFRLLPHGIFELPAVIISLALGLKIGISLIYNCIILYNNRLSKTKIYLIILISILLFPISIIIITLLLILNKSLRIRTSKDLIDSMKVFVFVVIPLLVIAGIIEGILIFLIE